jgi:hypothetical protein
MNQSSKQLLLDNGSKLPLELKGLDYYCLWKYLENSDDPLSPGKIPLDWTDSGKGNDNSSLHTSLPDALNRLVDYPDAGLAIYQPEEGLKLSAQGKEGYLYILDLDGFLCGDDILDLGWDILALTDNSYFEVSPSQVGIKIYIVSDLEPISKVVYKLPPNIYSSKYPDIKKYSESHAVEVFAKKFWNTVSGNRWGADVSILKFVDSDKLNKIFSLLESVSIKRSKSKKVPTKKNTNINQKNEYAQLTQESLEFTLSKIDHFDEENWGGGQDGGGVVNILARVYGEDGRRPFIEWSRGDYSGKLYTKFDEDICNSRFNRALRELSTRPNGFGIPQLCRLANISMASVNFLAEKNPGSKQSQAPSQSVPELVFRYTNDEDQPLQVTENLKVVMDRRRIIARYNQITKNPELLLPNMQCVLDEVDNTAITLLTDSAIKAGMSSARIIEMATAIASQNPYCPVRTYIESKPWDGISRFDQFFQQIKTADIDMSKFLMRKWLIQAVAAVYEINGLSGAGTIVFTGLQGVGKTRLFKDLTSGVATTFLEGATLDPSNKDSVMTVCSHWIVELGELDATFKKSDVAQLKAFLTKNIDTLRRPYAKKDSTYRRRTVFAGTVNDLEFLHDPTGNRRFWPIDASSIIRDEKLNYQQLWAEVKTWYEAEETWHLSAAEIQKLNEYSEQFVISDPLIEALHTRYGFAGCSEWEPVLMKQIALQIGLDRVNKGESMRIAAAIRKANGGQKPKNSNGNRYHFVPAKEK